MQRKTIFIAGCVGVPAAYGGFETLAENLVLYREQADVPADLTVFCSRPAMGEGGPSRFHGAELVYLPLQANGVASIPYDIWSLLIARWRGADTVLLLGISGALAIPLIRLLGHTRIVTNIDGIEWRRQKWGRLASSFLRFSEWLAVRCSHVVVADNDAVADYVQTSYGASSTVIAYGGDQAVNVQAAPLPFSLPDKYALALCRIEPENNIEMILEAFARSPELPIAFVGNWESSDFGREMRNRYKKYSHVILLDPLYDLGALKTLRMGASLYVHGHSAGGTNPSLVEAMHFGKPVAAFDCGFNRRTTAGKALFFKDAEELGSLVSGDSAAWAGIGEAMQILAREEYVWKTIGAQYFQIL